ncbi:hypothetical protein CYLTODRAFT_424466 [Cylindrobasidium torrendii FP15055 ss-10]|uniref:Uncharacterized protein n=1 Tax=Cylindrobasidium torrendii FP15055 ss-10 TaxID=1314674 RepID=A0A0D7B545_9AGAR|nr:hypothetical protein CYLTODRAFT_424466 [Cylindrobasidium torrendii FP15055 ss-10]
MSLNVHGWFIGPQRFIKEAKTHNHDWHTEQGRDNTISLFAIKVISATSRFNAHVDLESIRTKGGRLLFIVIEARTDVDPIPAPDPEVVEKVAEYMELEGEPVWDAL